MVNTVYNERSTTVDKKSGQIIGACQPFTNRTRTYVDSYENVTSYRGNSRWVMHGGKRKRAYNVFSKYAWLGQYEASLFCGPLNEVAYYEQLPLSTFRHDTYDAKFSDPNYFGGNPPSLVTPYQLVSYGQKYRDFVIRDMFVKAKDPRFDSAVFMAELDECLVGIYKLFRGSLTALWKANGISKQAKHFALNPEGLWLWWRYALLPAMMDAEDLIAALPEPDPITRIQDGNKYNAKIDGECSYGNMFGLYPLELSWKADLKAGYGGALDIESIVDHFKWGTSTLDVVRAVYERIPFSFVFDWFFNLGDYLQTLRDVDVVVRQSYATFAIELNYEFDLTNYLMAAPAKLKVVQIDRIVSVEPPGKPLVDPHWNNILRSIDSISLVVGTLKGLITVKKKRKRKKRRR